MEVVMSDLQKRQQVLHSVVSVICNMPDDRLTQILAYMRKIEGIDQADNSDGCPLSKREKEVLVLIANGYSRKQVGESLGISANTAARHISTIYSKLDVSSIAEATCYAIRKGIT